MKLKNALGPLKDIYKNNTVSEIIVDAFDDVYYFDKGKCFEEKKLFRSQIEVESVISDLMSFAGINKQKDTYSYDFSLDERTRINIVLPPMSLRGAVLNILKIPARSIGWEDYIKFGSVKESGMKALKDIVNKRENILVAGPAGSGKTTLLNLLTNTIEKDLRVVTIERTPSLNFDRKKTVKLQAPNHKIHEMKVIIETASKMRPDYLVHSYVEGPEAMDFIELIREGYSALALVSGENIFDAIKNLELKCQSSNYGRTIEDIRYAIAHAFNYIVFQEKMPNDNREITKIAKMSFNEGKITLDVIYTND